MLGKIFKLVEQDVPAMIGTTAIILTADHGNQDNPPTGADRYAVPFYVWGPGVKAGADLYALNAGTRQVAASYPMTTYAGMQPVRNAEANNLALQLLGLGPIPGSSFNYAQELMAAPATVRIDGYSTAYYSLGEALAAAPAPVSPAMATEIRAQALPTVFAEEIIVTNPVAILLRGGYVDEGFSDQSGYSTIVGFLKLQAGKLLVERLNIKAP